ncbi:MAG: phosphatase, partial [Spirochaetaceae bacterium]|nr:phosphatase [Spirochaetaceae bacterium]
LERLHFVMAGLHEACFAPRSVDENTRALVMALRNPRVDAISHPGNTFYPVDIEALVEAARAEGKALEINNSSFKVRSGSADTCLEIARACARTGTRVVVGSDAHYWRDVGNFASALKILREARIPRELVVNASLRSFEKFINRRANAV